MSIKAVLLRTQRGLRDDLRLHVVAVLSLVVAFLCLGTALLSVENLSRIAERWSRTEHLTVYLHEGTAEQQAQSAGQLRLVLEQLREITKVEYVPSARARELFAEQVDVKGTLSSLPSDVFPAALELELAAGVDGARIDKLAQQVGQLPNVEEVETYRSFIGQFHLLIEAGRSGALLLSLLVIVCVLAIIGNTIRIAVANRKREIEVLKLCGATDAFVRGPFLVEGVLQAMTSATLAILLLLFAYLLMRSRIEGALATLTGVSSAFLSPLTVCCVIGIAGAIGGIGSAWSLRRYLQV
ncbi:MAG: hypothetical protein RL701_3382 [Pseudomonadota bacterium]